MFYRQSIKFISSLFMACLAWGIFTGTQGRANSLPLDIEIGGVAVKLAPPDDMTFLKGAAFETILKAAPVPPENICLAACLRDDEVPKALSGTLPSLSQYGLVQLNRKLEHRSVSSADFTKFKQIFEKSAGSRIDQNVLAMEKQLSEFLHREAKIDVASIGVLDSGPDFLCSLMVVRSTQTEADVEQVKIASMSVLNIKSRMIFVYLYTNYSEKSDIEWMRAATKQMVDRTIAANRP